jgi:hypothetical protein
VRAHDEIDAVFVLSYRGAPLVQARAALQSGDEGIVQRALEFRETTHLPFWDSVMMCMFSSEAPAAASLDAALYHQSQRGAEIALKRGAVLAGALGTLSRDTDPDHSLAISSEVRCADGCRRHLPLLDFHCPVSDRGGDLVLSVARRLLGSGFLLLKGHNSFHLWGLNPVSTDSLIDFLARALLFAPIVDRAYVAHQLLERRCALRISAATDKPVPYVVHVEPFGGSAVSELHLT